MATLRDFRGTLATAQGATGLTTDGVLVPSKDTALIIQGVGANTPVFTARLAISIDGGTTFATAVFDHNDVAAQATWSATRLNICFVVPPLPAGAIVKLHVTAYTSGDLTVTYWMS